MDGISPSKKNHPWGLICSNIMTSCFFTPKKWCTHKSHQNSMTRTMRDIYHISYIMYV
jgi:hypothetical protein